MWSVHWNFPLRLAFVIMLFSAVQPHVRKKKLSSIVKLSRLFYFNFSLCDITFRRTRFLFYKLWHVASYPVVFIRNKLFVCCQRHAIRAGSGKKLKYWICSSCLKGEIKLQRSGNSINYQLVWSHRSFIKKFRSLFLSVNTDANTCEDKQISLSIRQWQKQTQLLHQQLGWNMKLFNETST